MKRSTFSVRFLSKRLPLVLFSFASVLYFSQTEKQKSEIKEKTNLSQLTQLQKESSLKKLTKIQLQNKAKQLNVPYSGEVNGKLFELQGFDSKTKRPIYYISSNADASAGTETNKLNSSSGIFNLDGQGITLYEWDGGAVNLTHQEFGGRVTQGDAPSSYSDHSTHVAGTMVASGVEAAAKGMAPKANLTAYDWNSDESEMATAAANAALVSNHSYGYVGGFSYGNWSGSYGWHWFGEDSETEFWGYGKYVSYDTEWDLIANNAPYYLPVKSAGNPRGDGPAAGGAHYVFVDGAWVSSTKTREVNGGTDGYDCLMYGNTAKNILVVAAAGKLPNNTYSSASDVEAASFSAFGPTDDGRIKPDITGIGVNIYSAITGSDTSYESMSGTSMSSPNVSGSLGLLQQHYQDLNSGSFMKAATLKAVILSTAKEAGNVGPDYKYGWGLLDAYKAAQTISYKDKLSLIQERTLTNGNQETIQLVASGSEPIIATIVWNDPVPEVDGGSTDLNDRTPMLVNDLDTEITDGTNTYNPWVLDPENPNNPATTGDNIIDNVEQVYIANPVAGATYTLTISHKGTLKSNLITSSSVTLQDASSQDYSLVVTGIKNNIQTDLGLTALTVDVPQTLYSTATPITATYYNNGATSVDNAQLKYTLTNKDTNTVVTTSTVSIPSLAAESEASTTFNLDLSTAFVNYDIKAEIILTGDEVELNNQLSTSVFGTLVDLTDAELNHSFEFENNFMKYGWISQDVDGDGRTWYKYDDSSFANSGDSFAINFPNLAFGTNDWLFSNPLKLKAGGTYRVVFYTRKIRTYDEPLNVAFGTSPEASSMTNIVASNILPTTSYVRYVYNLTPTTDGVYYIGFQNTKDAATESYAVFMDDFYIDQTTKPIVDFAASTTTANSYTAITLTDKSYTDSSNPITAYEWTFVPNTVTYQNGTSSTSQNPQVILAEGTYDVTLKATNSSGDDSATKEAYITVANTETSASFSANEVEIYANGIVTFSNTSTGNPAPTTWNWEVSPSDGVTFVNSTTATSAAPSIQFANIGTYSISLTATSELNSDVETKTGYITVKPLATVTNLQGNGDSSKNVTLTWDRPELDFTLYNETFEGTPKLSATYDEDGDTRGWGLTTSYPYNGTRSAVSFSYYSSTARTVSNWMVTSLINKGGERLSYYVLYPYNEFYDVYLIKKEDIAGSAPTLAEIKSVGTQIYNHETYDALSWYENIILDISAYKASDIFLAFHHKSTAALDGWFLEIDDIAVGFEDNLGNSVGGKDQISSTRASIKAIEAEGKVLVPEKVFSISNLTENKEVKEEALKPILATEAVESPAIVGYEIARDGNTVGTLSDYNTLTYSETVPDFTSYTYDVYALYAGSLKSDKQTVIVDLTSLSTSEVQSKDAMKVYPNPSSGNFKVDGGSKVSALDGQVFDMSGKLILSKKSTSRYLDIDLTDKGKGVYILIATDNNGAKYSVKLVVK